MFLKLIYWKGKTIYCYSKKQSVTQLILREQTNDLGCFYCTALPTSTDQPNSTINRTFCQWQKILLVQQFNLVTELFIFFSIKPLLKNQKSQASKSSNLHLYKNKSPVDFFWKTVQSYQNTILMHFCRPANQRYSKPRCYWFFCLKNLKVLAQTERFWNI